LYQDLVARQDIFGGSLLQWNECGSKKVVLQVESTSEFQQLTVKAEKSGLPFATIEDAGLTQVPSGSRTVLAVFGAVSDVDVVTGHLRLL
jgi:peptidyl-tRNA hydrolase